MTKEIHTSAHGLLEPSELPLGHFLSYAFKKLRNDEQTFELLLEGLLGQPKCCHVKSLEDKFIIQIFTPLHNYFVVDTWHQNMQCEAT